MEKKSASALILLVTLDIGIDEGIPVSRAVNYSTVLEEQEGILGCILICRGDATVLSTDSGGGYEGVNELAVLFGCSGKLKVLILGLGEEYSTENSVITIGEGGVVSVCIGNEGNGVAVPVLINEGGVCGRRSYNATALYGKLNIILVMLIAEVEERYSSCLGGINIAVGHVKVYRTIVSGGRAHAEGMNEGALSARSVYNVKIGKCYVYNASLSIRGMSVLSYDTLSCAVEYHRTVLNGEGCLMAALGVVHGKEGSSARKREGLAVKIKHDLTRVFAALIVVKLA